MRVTIQSAPDEARRAVVRELGLFLRGSSLRRVHFADGSLAPPPLAYVTNFARLSIPLEGFHTMQLARNGRTESIRPVRGHAVFVPGHSWNLPDWAHPVKVLTFLFGNKQIGVSLVRHKPGSDLPASALKTNVHRSYDGLTENLLSALTIFAADHERGPLGRLLTESLLYSCLRLFSSVQAHRARKGMRTYEGICLYVQENFRGPISRELVAEHFGLSPTHVSRLFRQEGLMRYSDYVNLVRVNRAKFVLRNYNMTLKEVAANCGYSDAAYFCQVFKRISKVTPAQYKHQRVKGITPVRGTEENLPQQNSPDRPDRLARAVEAAKG
jgi:AraC-like DNA-binding protein